MEQTTKKLNLQVKPEKAIKSDTKDIKGLGSGVTKYPTTPSAKIFELFTNQHPKMTYLVPFSQDVHEFTSLCPKTKQPDFAKMEIIYVPNEKMVESKSLKLYLFSFRNKGEFHEDVVNRIAKDLFTTLQPKYLRVFGDFAPRGGLAIKPLVEWWGKEANGTELSDTKAKFIERIVDTYDIKK